ncbi:MAG: hypothetical protein ACE5NW_07280 [Acidiferrobacterales bacterium]
MKFNPVALATSILLATCLLDGAHCVTASDDLPEVWQEITITAGQKKVVRKGSIPSRTDKHRERMDALAYEIFEPKVPGLEYHGRGVNSKDLFERFGEPVTISIETWRHRDPPPGGPAEIEGLTWQFPRMIVKTVSYPPSADHRPEKVLITAIDISSANYALKHGLRIGQPASTFISILGEPNYRNNQKLEYLVEDWIELENRTHIDSYQIHMFLDNEGKVEKIVWRWEGVYH